MPKTDVIALVEDLAGDRSDTSTLTDSTAIDQYYRDAVYEFGLLLDGLTDADFVATTNGTAVYTQPSDAIQVLMLCYGEVQLRPTMRRALEAYAPLWRTKRGSPQSFTTTDANIHQWRMVPIPDHDGSTIGALTPFDAEFPADNLTFISTITADNVPLIDELWLTFDVLAREFSRESDHRDPQFAKVCLQLSILFKTFVGFEERAR